MAAGLGLGEGDLTASYEVLRDMGNCSSATVLLVVDQLLASRMVPPGVDRRDGFWPGLDDLGTALRIHGVTSRR